MSKHTCPFGDVFCGTFGYSDLCDYCKKDHDLKLAARENEIAGQAHLRRKIARQEANEALGEFVEDHPIATIGGLLLAIGIGTAAKVSKEREETRKKTVVPPMPLNPRRRSR